MSEHTPGPWTSYTGTHSIWAEGQRAICVMTGARKTADMERDANARLIAAAPDLLTSLQALVALHDEFAPGLELNIARRVIAKATGEPA